MFKRVLQMAAVLAITAIGIQSSEAGHRHHRRAQSCCGQVSSCAPAPVVECCAPAPMQPAPMPQPAPPQQPPMPPQQPMPPMQVQGCGAPGCGAPVSCCAPAPTCCDVPVNPCDNGCGGGRRHHGLFGHHHRRGASASCGVSASYGAPVAMAGCGY